MVTLRECIDRWHAAHPMFPLLPGEAGVTTTVDGGAAAPATACVQNVAPVDPVLPTEFGPLLRHLRRLQAGRAGGGRFAASRPGISQNRLADLAGIDVAYICRLESGQQQPSYHATLRLANAMRLPVREKQVLLRAAGYGAAQKARAS